jgi:hypothetical protein
MTNCWHCGGSGKCDCSSCKEMEGACAVCVAKKFNIEEAKRLKGIGMARAESVRSDLLLACREACKRAALERPGRWATADDGSKWLEKNYPGESLGPAMGSLFRGGEWETTGEFIKSKKVSNHARVFHVWKLRDGVTATPQSAIPVAPPRLGSQVYSLSMLRELRDKYHLKIFE